jgi:hypothetical protein
MAGPVLNVIYPARYVRRDIAEANKAALGETAVYRVLAATATRDSEPAGPDGAEPDGTDEAVVAVAGALATARENAEVVISALLPYRRPRLEFGSGIAEEVLELTAEMTRVESASRLLEERGVTVKTTARLAASPAAELADLASMAQVLVISAEHPDYQAATAASAVPVTVTLAADTPAQWDAIVVRAGTGADASAATEMAGLLAAGGHTGVVVDPAGLTGRGLDRFVAPLREAGLSTEITDQVPDGALVVGRPDGPQAGAHLIVRAAPGYTPAESAPLAVADLVQEDR